MELTLINGQFSASDATDILTEMIKVKIRFHENKISSSCSQEDIKMRENKIKFLQKELANLRKQIKQIPEKIKITATIELMSTQLVTQ